MGDEIPPKLRSWLQKLWLRVPRWIRLVVVGAKAVDMVVGTATILLFILIAIGGGTTVVSQYLVSGGARTVLTIIGILAIAGGLVGIVLERRRFNRESGPTMQRPETTWEQRKVSDSGRSSEVATVDNKGESDSWIPPKSPGAGMRRMGQVASLAAQNMWIDTRFDVWPPSLRLRHTSECQRPLLAVERLDEENGEWIRRTFCHACGASVEDDRDWREQEQGDPDWGAWHNVVKRDESGFEQLSLSVKGLGTSPAYVSECVVYGQGVERATARMGEWRAATGKWHTPPVSETATFYVENFPDAPEILTPGIYVVRWIHIAGLGEAPLKEDAFEIKDGRLVR